MFLAISKGYGYYATLERHNLLTLMFKSLSGTFGQQEPWNIYDKSTFAHPMVPYDVLIDPQSLPNHPVLDVKTSAAQVIHAESLENGYDDSDEEEGYEEKKEEKRVILLFFKLY